MDDITTAVADMSVNISGGANAPHFRLQKENRPEALTNSTERRASDSEREQESSIFQELSPEKPRSPARSISPPVQGRFLGAVEAPAVRSRVASRASRNAFEDLGTDTEADAFVPLRPRSMLGRPGILPYNDEPARDLNWSRGARSSMGIREERGKVQALENEIFQLKMRIKELEEGAGTGADGEELADAKQSCEQWKSRANLLDKDLQNEIDKSKQLELRATEFENIAKELTDMAEETTALDAQNCLFILKLIKRLHMYNQDVVVPSEAPKTPRDGLVTLEAAIEDAADYWKGVEQTLEMALSKAEEADAAYGSAAAELEEQQAHAAQLEHLLSVASAPLGAKPENLAAQISSLLNENHVLEGQLREKEDHHSEMIDDLEDKHKAALAESERKLDQTRRELEIAHDEDIFRADGRAEQLRQALQEQVDVNEKQMQKLQAASVRDYDLLRMFFRRVQKQMPRDWADDIERELGQVIERAQSEQRSKLPLINDLQLKYVDRLCRQSLIGLKAPAELKELRARCKSLDGILREELRRLGADQVLLAQFKVVQEELKKSEEKRRLEYDSYQQRLDLD